MNIPTELAKQVIDGLKASPFVLALIVINVISLAGFGYILHEVSEAIERREALIKACIERRL